MKTVITSIELNSYILTDELKDIMRKIMSDELSLGQSTLPDQCSEVLERINQILEELEKPRNRPSKEQVFEQLERMFNELEEGKITYSPSVRNRFQIGDL